MPPTMTGAVMPPRHVDKLAEQTLKNRANAEEQRFNVMRMIGESINARWGPEKMHQAFQHLDVDGSGTLTVEELAYACERLWNIPMDGSRMTQLMQACDANGDGKISYFEFVNAIARDKVASGAVNFVPDDAKNQETKFRNEGHMIRFIPNKPFPEPLGGPGTGGVDDSLSDAELVSSLMFEMRQDVALRGIGLYALLTAEGAKHTADGDGVMSKMKFLMVLNDAFHRRPFSHKAFASLAAKYGCGIIDQHNGGRFDVKWHKFMKELMALPVTIADRAPPDPRTPRGRACT